jgi:hypothetical protein
MYLVYLKRRDNLVVLNKITMSILESSS